MHPRTSTEECQSFFAFHWLAARRYSQSAERRIAFLLLVVGTWLMLVQPCVGGSGVFEDTSSFTARRYQHTSTLLQNGKVLIAGAFSGPEARVTELYDLPSGTWTATGNLSAEFFSFTATLLPSGKVLIAGGYIFESDTSVPFAGAELYDPASGTWAATGSLGNPAAIRAMEQDNREANISIAGQVTAER